MNQHRDHEGLKPSIQLWLLAIVCMVSLMACHSSVTSEGEPVTESEETRDSMMGGSMMGGSMMGGSMMGGSMMGGSMMGGSMMGEAWIKIGTGFRRYEPLEEGQEVPVIAGIQGGFHVWGGFVGAGFDDTDVRITYSLELEGIPLATADYIEFELPKNHRGEFEYAGVSVIYFENDDVERTSGLEMTLKLSVETLNGQRLIDDQTLFPRCCE
jgi:hypothetical protein